MIPQGFPLWLVPDGSFDVWIVIGWREGRHGVMQPVAAVEEFSDGTQAVGLGDTGWSLFTDRVEARQCADER